MNRNDFLRIRLLSQRLHGNPLQAPAEVARWMGALQAQDYLGALWAVGLRSRQSIDREVEQALTDGSMVRTWPLRGTLHIVAAQDARWITELCAPRILAGAAARHLRDFELDEVEFGRAREALTQALQGGRQLERDGMFRTLNAAGIATAGQRGYHIIWRLAQEGLLCYGPRAGRPQTFVLLAEWVPGAKGLVDRETGLAELARRYFTSHGPATLYDFAWWSGLTVRDAQFGLEASRPHLERDEFEGQAHWFRPPEEEAASPPPAALLLPAYDEYTVAYKDRAALLHPDAAQREEVHMEMLQPVMVIGGQVRGTWKRALRRGRISIGFSPFSALNEDEQEALSAAAERYGEHLSLPPGE